MPTFGGKLLNKGNVFLIVCTKEDEGVLDKLIPSPSQALSHQYPPVKRVTHTARLKPASVNRALISLKRYFGWCVSQGLLALNPARVVKLVEQATPPPRNLADQEEQALIAAVTATGNLRDRAIIVVLLHTGLRRGTVSIDTCISSSGQAQRDSHRLWKAQLLSGNPSQCDGTCCAHRVSGC